MKIAILGGGHGAYAAAADLSETGHEVRLWRRDAAALQPLLRAGAITLKDADGSRDVPIALATGVPLRKFLAAVAEPVTIAFGTANSEAALPRAMDRP